MNVRDDQRREHETIMQQAYRKELIERIERAVRQDGVEELLPGLYLARCSVPLQPVHSVVEPSICVIAQGSKEVLLGESRYCYDPAHYLLTTIALPRVSQVLSASKEHPYLSLLLQPHLFGAREREAHGEAQPIRRRPYELELGQPSSPAKQ